MEKKSIIRNILNRGFQLFNVLYLHLKQFVIYFLVKSIYFIKKFFVFLIPKNTKILARRLFILSLLALLLNNRIDFLTQQVILAIEARSVNLDSTNAIVAKNDLIYSLLANGIPAPQSLFDQLNMYLGDSNNNSPTKIIESRTKFSDVATEFIKNANNTRNFLEHIELLLQVFVLLYSYLLTRTSWK